MAEPSGELTQPKVLVVDDRQENLLAAQAILQGLPLQVVGVDSGEAALKELLRDEFALILMDAQMPHMDGFETAGRIKQRERTRTIPIVFLTVAEYDSQLALRGYAAGAVDYVTKPLDPWVLRAKVSVFVDLWEGNRRVRAQAARTARLQRQVASAAEQVGHCLDLVADVNANPGAQNELRSLLTQLADELRQ